MESNITYGTYIRNRRKELGLSQYDVSEILLTSTQALSQYENDKVSINLSVLGAFCRVLQVDIKHFLTKTVGKDNNLVDSDNFDPNKFSATLVSFRTSRNLSQKELALALNVSNNKISKWETGNSLPSLEEFLNIIDYYKVDPDEFYFGKIDSFKSPEVSVVKVKSKSKKLKIGFMTSVISIAVILGITLPLTLRNQNPEQGQNIDKPNKPDKPDDPTQEPETKIFKVKIVFEGELIPAREIEVKEGEKIPNLALTLPLEYQEEYEIEKYTLNGENFDINSEIFEDITIKCILKKKVIEEDVYYTVTFFDVNKTTPLGNPQKVLKGNSAVAPDINLLEKVSGYEFERRDKDFTMVESDLNIYPILKAYKTTLHFISENENIPDFIDYTHDSYDLLPVAHKEGYIFDCWLLKSNDKFTKTTFLEKEMTLFARFVEDKAYKITFKGFPDALIVTANKNDYINYDLLPKNLLEGEKILHFLYNDEIINSSFYYEFDEDIELVPFFEEKYEYAYRNNVYEFIGFHSANEEVNLLNYFYSNGERIEYHLVKTNSIDIPRAKKLTINSNFQTRYYKNFIKNAPYLEHISFLNSDRYELDRTIYLAKDCLSNITTLRSLEFGLARDFNQNFYSILDFGFKFNDNFSLTFISKKAFEPYILETSTFFPKSKDGLEAYKKITIISFKEEGEVNFLNESFELFPNLKEVNILNDITKFKCLSFDNKELTFNFSDSVKEFYINLQKDINYTSKHSNKIIFNSNSELKISGTLYADEIDFTHVNNLIFDDYSYFNIFNKISFPETINSNFSINKTTLVTSYNFSKKVDVYFTKNRPTSLLNKGSFKPFKGVNDGLEEELFNFYII